MAIVTTIILAYNQEMYLEKAVMGAISQSIGLNNIIYILNDCSTDTTGERAKKYEAEYENVLCITNPVNLGPGRTFELGLSMVETQYVALCEADDYWIDDRKLEKQVRFLDHNPDCALVYTAYMTVDESNSEVRNASKGYSRNLYHDDILRGAVAHTLTILFRADALRGKIPQQVCNSIYGDKFIDSVILESGYAYYLSDVTSAYRVHGMGVYGDKTPSSRNKEMLRMYFGMYDYYYEKIRCRHILKKTIDKEFSKLFVNRLLERNAGEFIVDVSDLTAFAARCKYKNAAVARVFLRSHFYIRLASFAWKTIKNLIRR